MVCEEQVLGNFEQLSNYIFIALLFNVNVIKETITALPKNKLMLLHEIIQAKNNILMIEIFVYSSQLLGPSGKNYATCDF